MVETVLDITQAIINNTQVCRAKVNPLLYFKDIIGEDLNEYVNTSQLPGLLLSRQIGGPITIVRQHSILATPWILRNKPKRYIDEDMDSSDSSDSSDY